MPNHEYYLQHREKYLEYSKSYRCNFQRQCDVCGKTFAPRNKTQKYCSRACSIQVSRKNLRPQPKIFSEDELKSHRKESWKRKYEQNPEFKKQVNQSAITWAKIHRPLINEQQRARREQLRIDHPELFSALSARRHFKHNQCIIINYNDARAKGSKGTSRLMIRENERIHNGTLVDFMYDDNKKVIAVRPNGIQRTFKKCENNSLEVYYGTFFKGLGIKNNIYPFIWDETVHAYLIFYDNPSYLEVVPKG